MKKFFSLMVIAAMSVTMVGCGEKPKDKPADKPAETKPADKPAEPAKM